MSHKIPETRDNKAGNVLALHVADLNLIPHMTPELAKRDSLVKNHK